MFKNIPRKYSLALLAVFIVLLYVTLNKVIVPFTMKVMDSELFLASEEEESEELGKIISNERTNYALAHCKNSMRDRNKLPENAIFNDRDYEAWALGGKTYLIRSQVTLPVADQGPSERKFACKMRLSGNDASEAGNWSILGIDFNEGE